ncbi:MAG: hypothetical protein ACXWLV_10135, partial [Rhizomicrobium sp.]
EFATRDAFLAAVPAFVLLSVGDVFPSAVVFFRVEPALLDIAFFEDFFGALLAAFFATTFFFTDFLAVFLAVFLACFVRVFFLARFFSVDALAVCARDDVRAFFALCFLAVFFLALATTNSFIA